MSGPLYSGTRQIAVTVDMPLTHGSFNGLMNGVVTTRIRSTAIHEQKKLSRGSCRRNSASKLPIYAYAQADPRDHGGKRTGNRSYGSTPDVPIGGNGGGGSRLRSHPLSFIDSHSVVGPKIASRREQLPIIRISVEGRVKRIAELHAC